MNSDETLTIRDQFALTYMQQALGLAGHVDRQDMDEFCNLIPAAAYKMADAMMKAREA